MSEVSSRKRSLEFGSDEQFKKLLVLMVYSNGDMSYYERDYDSSVDLSTAGSMTCCEADALIGLFCDNGLIREQWSKVKDLTSFYRLQHDYKCFVLVLHDLNE